MWQSHVEIEDYSIVYFDCITVSKVPITGSYALHRLVSYSCIYEARMSPALNGSSVIWHFERSDAIEIRKVIIFNFYTGLSHMQII